MAKSTKKEIAEPQAIKAPRWAPWVAFFAPLIAYLLTTAHSVTFEDSGVFIGAAASLGLPQPPGYPLYTLIAWLFTHLPVDTVAFRVHLFSALCGAGAATLFYFSALRIFRDFIVALFMALMFAFADTLWAQAIVAEVYPLHILLFSALFYLTLKIAEEPARKNFVAFGAVFGLALANHWPLLVLASPMFLLFAWERRRDILKNVVVWSPLALVIAAGFYLFMMWRSQQQPAASFLGPIESLKDLLAYIGRGYYRSIEEKWQPQYFDKLLFFGDGVYGVLWREWYLLGTVLLATGLVALKNHFPSARRWGLLFAFLSTNLFLQFTLNFEFNHLNQNVMKVFHLVPIFAVTLVMGAGFVFLRERLGQKFLYAAAAGLTVTIVANFIKNDLRTDRLAEGYARFIFKAIPVKEKSQAVIAGTDADVGPMAYLHIALNERPDLRLYTQSGVYFKERIFSPFIFKTKVRYEKTEQFIKNEGVVYSTKSMDIFEATKNLPFDLRYNGLFYEISAGAPQPLNIGPEFTDLAVRLLDEYIANPRAANWRYHRETLAARLCNFIVLRDVQHKAFTESPACQQVWARHLAKLKRYAEADKIFHDLLSKSRWMVSAERHLIRYHMLVNRLEWINAEPGTLAEKKAKVLAAVEEVKMGLTEYPHCGNSLFTVINSLRGQVELSADVEEKLGLFKKCKK